MAEQTRRFSYEVYLESDVAEELDVDSPIATERIDYYDAGLWITRETGRDFYPYRHVMTIQERPAEGNPDVAGGETDSRAGADESEPAEGEAGKEEPEEADEA